MYRIVVMGNKVFASPITDLYGDIENIEEFVNYSDEIVILATELLDVAVLLNIDIEEIEIIELEDD